MRDARPLPNLDDLTPTREWYLDAFLVLAEHLTRPPSSREFADWIRRDVGSAYRMLRRLELEGWLTRDHDGRIAPR